MILYKATIMPMAAFTSPLQSDTFFGAFCWSYKYLYGEEVLKEFLQKNLEETPQIIFSNAFPSGYLPLPMGIYDQDRSRYDAVDKSNAKKIYQENKKYKKCTLIRNGGFQEIQKGIWRGYSKYVSGAYTKQAGMTHNMVNRSNGTVGRSDEGGNLYVTDEFFAGSGEIFDVYILSILEKNFLEKVLSLMFDLGIGADKSTGKGYFKLLSLEEEKELGDCEDANGYVALSNFIPAKNDPMDGWYRTLVKYGKLDREYATSQYPFKKPLLYIQAGAMFKTNQVKNYYGTFVKDASLMKDVVVNACTITLPIRIPEQKQEVTD